MSFEDQDMQQTLNNPEVQAQITPPEDAAPHAVPDMPSVEQTELEQAEGDVIQAAGASDNAEWLIDALAEEAEEKSEEKSEEEAGEEKEKAETEAEAEEAMSDDESDMSSETDATSQNTAKDAVEAGSEVAGAEAAGGAAASSGGISSAWLWGGLAVAGAAAAAGGGSSTPGTPASPTVTLDTDSGAAGDGITNVAIFTVGGLEENTTWEYSTDGGATWVAGSGSSFEITQSGDYTVVVRQTRDTLVSENSASLDVALDNVDPIIDSGNAASIDENTDAGSVVYNAAGTDDFTVTYSLEAGSDEAMSIDSNTGEVTLAGSPDHETQASYNFTVVATDVAGNSSEEAVTLLVNDLDEIAPIITSGATVAAIDENTASGQVIYTATADDTADVSGGVTFSLEAGSDAALLIDGNTGAVSLSDAPDFETQSSYSFTVTATDSAANADSQAVTLSINNLDESAPTITSGTTASALDENSPADSIVYTATSTDDGDISTGSTTYSLGASSDAALSINAQTGAVTLTGVANFEQQESYTFVVEAIDAGDNKSTKSVTLEINNLDEVAPVFTSNDQVTAIDENTAANQVIYTAIADDTADVSGGVIFSLKAGSDAALLIDANTGAVSLSDAPDFEIQSSYSFTVVATDGAGNSIEQTLTIDINDLDEDAPVFTSAVTASVAENVVADSAVYTAAATDGSPMTFSLAAEDASSFTIDANTGVVSIVGSPNFETQSEYTFTVTATDSAANADSQAVTLSINNLDESAPTITSGTTASALAENSGANQVIYTVTSTDDGDISAGVTYSLAGVTPDEAFSINTETGAVTLSTNPDHETQSSYSFTVVAKDAAGNESQQAVTLAVTNLDESAPTFLSATSFTALTSTPFLYQATVDDSADTSAGIIFSLDLTGDAALMQIDAEDGVVSIKDGLVDPAIQDAYTFTVIADDGVNAAVSQTVELTVPAAKLVLGAGGVKEQGGILIVNIDNGDGTYTLEFYVDDLATSLFPNGVENFDFIVTYSPDQVNAVVAGDFETSFAIPLVNAQTAGKLVVSAIDLSPLDLADGTPLGSLTLTPTSEANFAISVSDVILNTTDLDTTQGVYGAPVIITGSADNDAFILLGGESAITSGDGIDPFIFTSTTGSGTTLTDFMPGEDFFDVSSLLTSVDYTSLSNTDLGSATSGVARKYSDTSIDLLELLETNDATFDNAFGMLIDETGESIVVFYDANSDANTIDTQFFEINIGSAVTDVTLDDLVAGIDGFIA